MEPAWVRGERVMMVKQRQQQLYDRDFSGIRGEISRDEPMRRHTSWRTGGVADIYYAPADRDDLVEFLTLLPADVPITWVGLGSNLLVRDAGIRGVVIAPQKGLNGLRLQASNSICVEAGVPGNKLARFAVRHRLTGAEFFAGIPGTFGGALAMNAGAFGGATWDVVEAVETVDSEGRLHQRSRDDYQVGYRTVTGPAEWFVSGKVKLVPAGHDFDAEQSIRDLLSLRAETQPIQTANAGSVFRNPEGGFAAQLIESCGLKGYSVGDAEVSRQHANFIINHGGASADDIERLINDVREKVRKKTGVKLEPEIHIVGEDPVAHD
jgi:UDP-N-acetylmuramate dehydrogenase